MTAAAVLLLSLGAGPGGSLSTDDLDGYVRQVLQARSSCGPTAAWYCLRRLGRDVRLDDVWQRANIQADGISLQEVLDLLHAYDVSARAVSSTGRDLDGLPVPAILVVGRTHCVVFEGLTDAGRQVRCFEPASGEVRTVARAEVEKLWTGQAVLFESPRLSPSAFAAVAALGAFGVLGIAGRPVWRRATSAASATAPPNGT